MSDLEQMEDEETGVTRLVNWRRYQKAIGYDVEVKVTYTKTRKIRAESEEQAREFAIERETRSANSANMSKGTMGYKVNEVSTGEVTLVADREGDDG